MNNFSFCAFGSFRSRLFLPFLFIVSASLFFQSCSSSKKTTEVPAKPVPPVVKEEKKEEPKSEVNKPLNFSLLLPLDLKNQLAKSDDTTDDNSIDANVMPQLQFLEGALMAADSMKALGIDLSIKTIDVPADSVALTNIFYRKEVLQADVIFAAVNSSLANAASTLALKHKNKIVFNQPASASILKQNKDAYLSVPSTTTQCEQAADFVMTRYPSAKIFIVTRDNKREKDIAEIFRRKISAKANYILYSVQLFDSLSSALSRTAQNVIIMSSSDQDFVSPLLDKINGLNMANITVFGLPTWENFESIDYGGLKNLRFQYFTSSYTDVASRDGQNFRQAFINKYKTEPMYNAFQGFDLVMYFAKTFHSNKKVETLKLSQIPYDFKETPVGNGYENKLIHVLEIKDYELVKVN